MTDAADQRDALRIAPLVRAHLGLDARSNTPSARRSHPDVEVNRLKPTVPDETKYV